MRILDRFFGVSLAFLSLTAMTLGVIGCTPAGDDDDEGGGVTCIVQAGQCPNICASGIGVAGEACSSSSDCGCGTFCKVENGLGACSPYEGENAGCSCDATSGGAGGAGGSDGMGGAEAMGGMMMSMGGGGGGGPDINSGCDVPVGANFVCNPYCNLGCREGQHCTLVNQAIDCVQTGESALGDVCQGSGNCGDRMSCVRLTGEEDATCRQFCTGDADCPGGRRCDLNLRYGAEDRLALCGDIAVGCNPFEMPPSACQEGQGCYLNREATRCMTAGMLGAGEFCSQNNDCASGLQCLVVCTEICSLSGGTGTACADCPSMVHDARVSPDNDVGICLTEDIPAACDIYAQTGCQPGEGCYGLRGGHGCLPAGNLAAGSVCNSGSQCVPGTSCINGACLPGCTNDPRRDAQYQCMTMCPGETINLTPQIWQQGVCTNVEAEGACEYWDPMCPAGELCVPTIVGNTCRSMGAGRAAGEPCQEHTDCGAGLLCPRDVNACKTACSIAPFVVAPMQPAICADDCPNGQGVPIEQGSEIGYCP